MINKILGVLTGIVLAGLIIFLAILSNAIIQMIIHQDECNELGYRDASTKGFFDHTIICIKPISSHQELELN